jgi:hypothetical protein
MMNNYIRSVSDLKNVDLSAHQMLRILSSSKPFCVIVFSPSNYGFIHLTSNPEKIIRDHYKDEPAYNVFIYDLNN